jgi:hypothetical protein
VKLKILFCSILLIIPILSYAGEGQMGHAGAKPYATFEDAPNNTDPYARRGGVWYNLTTWLNGILGSYQQKPIEGAFANGDKTKLDGFFTQIQSLELAVQAIINSQIVPKTYFFISKTGNDSTGTGSEASPWLTIQKGIDSGIGPNDVLYVKAGTYNERLHLAGSNGTEGTPGDATGYAAIKAYPGDTVIIDGTGFTWGSAFNSGLYSTAARCLNYIEIDGFEIQNFPEAGITFWEDTDEGVSPGTSNGSHHIKLTNLNIHNNGNEGIIISGGAVTQSSDILIDNVTVSYNGKHGLKFNGEEVGVLNRRHIHDSTIQNCIVHHNGAGGASGSDGVGIHSSTGNYNITFYNNQSYLNETEGITFHENWSSIASYNTVYSNGTRAEDGDDHGLAVWSCGSGITVRDNSITNNPGYGLQIYDTPQANVSVCGNTISGNTLGSIDGSYTTCQ